MNESGYYAETTNKAGRMTDSRGPFPTRAEANAAALEAWPDLDRVTVSRNRFFDIQWINPRQIMADRARAALEQSK